MFEVKNVSKKYGDEYALKEITFQIDNGLNFIVGASGSGKSTLLKILSAIEQDFEGEVKYRGVNLKLLKDEDKSYFYNHVFGFVWQDFHLREDLTVLENVMLPKFLEQEVNKKSVLKLLKQLKISELANQKVKLLSGGQKQRVAIAKELVKNPSVIIADEPTSALDKESVKQVMDIFRQIAKTKTVIIVTHDTSLIKENDKIYELDKGQLLSAPTNKIQEQKEMIKDKYHDLNIKNAFSLAILNNKRNISRGITSMLSIVIASVLLITMFSGAITKGGENTFQQLYDTYGKSILDISIVSSFMSAGSSENKVDGPKADVKQNISGLYEKYLNDSRVDHIIFLKPFNDIYITIDGKKYSIENSNSVPVVSELTAGQMPMGDDNEVVVPQSFVKKLGISDKEVLGRNITFNGSVYNWDSGEPVLVPITVNAKIVGVADTTIKYNYEDEIYETSIDDSFFFSYSAMTQIYSQVDSKDESMNFSIRAKSPEDLISLKDELNAEGIVPIGQFELVEDIVRLNNTTKQQSSSAVEIITLFTGIFSVAISVLTILLRKKEIAIYKISGFRVKHLFRLFFMEHGVVTILSIIVFVICSPAINVVTKAMFNADILNSTSILIGMLFIIVLSIASFCVTAFMGSMAKITSLISTGEK